MLFLDRLANLVTGLAGNSDKKAGNVFVLNLVGLQELHAMYREDWLASKIVDIIPNDMTREGREWQADGNAIELIEAVEKSPRVNLLIKVNRALKMARLEGGAGIFIGIKGATPAEELELDRVGKDDLEYLHVLGQQDVTAGPLIKDVLSPYYDEPEYYELNGQNGTAMVRVHPSRIVRFVGAEILDRNAKQSSQWGDSVLQKVYAAIQNATSSQEHIASLIPEMKLDVLFMPGLSKALETEAGTAKVTARFTYANQMKLMFRMLLLEGNGANGDSAQGERWEQKTINFAQLPELMQQYLKIAAGAADITLMRLLQDAPSGLGANGDSGLKSYYDNVAARQRMELQPALNRLDEVIIRSATGKRDPSIYYTWRALYGLSETEKATIFKMKADAARTIAGTGGMSPSLMPIEALSDALVNELIEDGSLSGLETAIEEYGRLSEQEEDDADVEGALGVPANENAEEQQRQRLAANDAAPRSLYIQRKVKNAGAIIAWAKSQGFETTLPADDLHVTIAYSRAPVDWMKVGESWSPELKVGAGGPRLMEQFGDATVLLFTANELRWRNEAVTEAGGSWDHPEYQPHITISYGFKGDLSKVEPYQGPIVLGPELFSEVKEDWAEGLKET